METEQEPEAETTDDYVYLNPLSKSDLERIFPELQKLAKTFKVSDTDRDDLVSVALLELMDGNRKWTNPFVAAKSAMMDYVRLEIHKRPVRLDPFLLLTDGPSSLLVEYDDPLQTEELRQRIEDLKTFEGLGLSDFDRTVAVAHLANGETLRSYSDRTGVEINLLYSSIRRVRAAVREFLVDPEDDGQPDETERRNDDHGTTQGGNGHPDGNGSGGGRGGSGR